VSITLVHHFHPQVGTVQHICPSAHHTTLRIDDGLVEVETVQVERHRADAQCREPDTYHGPCTQEEVQGTRVVERCVLEDQATEVAVGCNDVVGLFFLTELVTVVLRFSFGGLTHQGGGDQGAVHCTEQATTEDTSYTQHVEGVHQDIVLSLEHEHEVEGARDSQGHAIREGTLSDGVDQEHCGCCCNGRGVGNADPRTHAEAVGEFPFPSHVAEDTNQEVQDNELVGTTVV